MMASILQMMGFSRAKPVHSRAGEVPPDPRAKPHPGAQAPTDQSQTVSAGRQQVKSKSGQDETAKAVVAAKSAAKPSAKTAKTQAAGVVAAKPAAKEVAAPAKAAQKPADKPVAKAEAKPAPKPAAKAVTAPAKRAAATVAPSAPAPAPTPAPAVAAKAGRPSARLAQLTVPSMAQTVASTAAKASYNPATITVEATPVIPSAVKKDAKLANNWKSKPPEQLTDAELIAMPDSEYMNDVQMAAFRIKLVNLKRDILSNAGETTEHLREDSSVVPDPADRATIEEEHALELRTRDRERKLLKKIEQSIARIDAGDYGYCDETGEPIGVGRLLARPTATLSLEAQQRRELKQKMFGD